MIYLIGGIAKAGKTYVAKQILRENQISSFSTDYLMMAIGKSNQVDLDVDGDDFIVAKQLESFLQPMIEAMIHNKVDYVIEGVHLLPEFINQFINRYPNDVRACFLGYSQVPVTDKINELTQYQQVMENCWYRNYSDEQMITLVEYLINGSKRIKESCLENDLPYYDISNILLDSEQIINDLFIK